ncbi:MAG: hypothetical protein WD733_04905 [Bryobacterales bacterium]
MRGILLLIFLSAAPLAASGPVISAERGMPPPAWALAERELLRAASLGAEAFYGKYVDEQGFLRCVERWGGNDGADDAMENFSSWTLLYALGADESVLDLYKKAWEGHLRQYTQARVPGIEMAENGMYHREFVTSFDWEHTGEALAAFHLYALCRPNDHEYRKRVQRFAGFYTGEDPAVDNYDRQHKIIKSLHNGSRGAKLTPATEQDWGGWPVEGRPERLTRYSTASNIRGDHPLNLAATTLAMNAYMLTGEAKYRDWLLEYAGAWRGRVMESGGNIPTNIGLDGKIGSDWGGKWWGGVFGWNFWPQESGRNYFIRGPRIAFGAALMLTADRSFAEPLRRQMANLYAAHKQENGRILLPNKHGDQGWYGYTRNQHFDVQRDLYLWSMDVADLTWLKDDPWISYLGGRNEGYPLQAFQEELGAVRRRVDGLRRDELPADQRASDHSQRFNPAQTEALVNLTLGGNHPGTSGNILHSRVRYFDPERRRAGLPEDVAALVERISPAGITLTLVNVGQVEPRTVVVQAGAYAEHRFGSVRSNGRAVEVNGQVFQVKLAPGAGETFEIGMELFAKQPAAGFPWE